MLTRQAVTRWLREQEIRPQRRMGQNFLVDPQVAARIVDEAASESSSCVVEIGAGLGALTEVLAPRFATVVAIECDRRLAEQLKKTFGDRPGVRVVCADVRRVRLKELLERSAIGTADGSEPSRAVVVGNLPYSITTPILEWLIEQRLWVHRAYLTMQREVAERVCAAPGGRVYGRLSCFLQYRFRAEPVLQIPPHAFYPEPQVESSCVRFEPYAVPAVAVADETALFRVIHAAFGQRRKTLLNALSAGCQLPRQQVEQALIAAAIVPSRRAETLSLPEFARLTECLRLDR